MSEDDKESTATSELEEVSQREEDHVEKTPGDGLARSLALLALLVAIFPAAAVYLLWQQDGKQKAAVQAQFLDAQNNLANAQASLDLRIDQLVSKQVAADEANTNLQKSLADLHEEIGRDRNAWAVAETVYFLQLANARVQLLKDVDTALEALNIADRRLQALGDPGFIPVREKIKTEITALQAVAKTDLTGTALSIGALTAQVPLLPLHAPAKRAQAQVEQATENSEEQQSAWRDELNKVWGIMRELVDVRRTDKPIEPLLKPEEQQQLVQNIQLQLQTARIAALQRDSKLYKDSLATASQWLQTYYDMDAEATRSAVEQIDKLAVIELSPALPDISASLRMLRSMSDKKARKTTK